MISVSARYRKWFLISLFAVYVSLLAYWVLFDGAFGRTGISNLQNAGPELYRRYFASHGNLIPFATIWEFVKGVFTGTVSFKAFGINIFGNIAVFAPFGFFLPMLFKRQRKLLTFVCTVALAVLCIEVMQFLLLTGSPDIDDLLLNLLGACTCWLVTVKVFNNSNINNKNRR